MRLQRTGLAAARSWLEVLRLLGVRSGVAVMSTLALVTVADLGSALTRFGTASRSGRKAGDASSDP